MLKVMTLIGTRPELIKMSRIIAEFDKYTKHILVHTGQNFDYELNQIFFDDLQIRKPNYFLDCASDTPAKTIARIIERTDNILEEEKPDAFLLYGDTNSGLAAIAAKRRKIPVFHMEAGNRCFDQRVPEELNRKIIDHISDINLVLTEHARRYLIGEGLSPERIIKTGSHMQEVLNYFMPQILKSNILSQLKLRSKEYFLCSVHREENIDYPTNINDLFDSLQSLVNQYNLPIIVSTHPRTKKKLESIGKKNLDPRIHFLKPFGFFDYIKLQIEALCVLSDSGTITEEASLLNLSAVNIRQSHERPEGMDAGTLVMCGLKKDRVLDSVKFTIDSFPTKCFPINKTIPDYDAGIVSKKILNIVLSYCDYVNHVVWKKF